MGSFVGGGVVDVVFIGVVVVVDAIAVFIGDVVVDAIVVFIGDVVVCGVIAFHCSVQLGEPSNTKTKLSLSE